MPNKNKSRSLFKPSWITILCLGIALGIASQQIQQVRAYTDEFIQPAEPWFAQESNPHHPISHFAIHRPGYSLSYSGQHRNPQWVFEHLSEASIRGDADRAKSTFKEDESIPEYLRSTLADYRGSGYDRGHQAAAANHKLSAEAMEDTFYLSNVCPQNPQCNRGLWARLERFSRELAEKYPHVYVTSGPLYLPNHEEYGRRFVKYEVIGPNDISVPTHFYKIIVTENWQGRKETEAFIVPNEEIPKNAPLENFKTSVEKVERAAGIIINKGA